MNGTIKTYAIIAFTYNGKRYTKTVNRSEMDLTTDPNTWFWYFDEDGLHFEVWGSVDDQGNPLTSSMTQVVGFAVNVYEPVNGYNEWTDQVDDIDVIERV